MSYFPEIAWGAIAKNVIPLYQEGTFQLNKYLIDVTPLDINEPGAMLMNCIVGDNFIDFLGYVYRIDNIESTAYGLKLLLYDINERSVSEYINYGPYQDRIGYVYRPTKYGIILSQAQILKLDSQARDRIGNIEKGVIWESLFHIDQTYPQTIFGGVPLFSSGLYTDFIDFNLESEIEFQEGRLSWDNDAGTLKLGLPGGNVTGQLFQEMLEKVKNESGVTIANGKAVYVSGAIGRNIKIGLGDSTDYLKSFIFGVTTEEIANNGFGYICTRGKVGGINTSSWEVNDKLWLTTNGNMSNVPPEAPGIKVFVGVVLIKHATEGVIDIKPTFVPRMSGLSDVYGTPSLDGQVYSWDTTEQRFILRNLIDSYVLEYSTYSLLPPTGEAGKIYITTDTNKTYRWSGSVYTEISPSLALGETSATAYRGDRGKIAYDHSQTTGNPHNTTFASITSKPTTLAGYGITDAANAVHGHNYITTILSGTLPGTLTDYSSYCTNYNKGVSIIANAGGPAVGNIGAIDTVVNFGVGSFRFFRLLNNRSGSLRWQTSNSAATDFAAERTLFDNYNYASYCPDLSAIESISGTNGLLRKTATNTWTLDTNDYSLSTHQHSFASITSKPTTLAGYGITDAYTKNNLQTSGGASVHWNNITNTPSTYTPAEHSHNYAGSITPSGTANSALLIKGTYTSQGGQQPPAYISSGYVRFNMMNTIINNNTSYKDFLLMDTYSGGDVPYVTALGVAKALSPRAFVMTGAKGGDAWASAELLSTYNYATYTLPASLKGAANGLAELDSGGKVPTSQLPSYVDDVLEYTTFSLLPSVGESGKIYITTDTNKTYRWSGSVYTEISTSLALGETSTTAYRGDRGKIAYDHSQSTGNPHATSFAQLGSKPTTLEGYGITDAIPTNINNGHYITDGVNLTGTYVGGSIRMSTQAGATGFPSDYGVTYTFDALTPSRAFSIFTPKLSNDLYIQKYNDSSVGLGWYKIFTTANLNPSNYLTKLYEPYSELTYGSSIIWNCSTGLNKTLTASGNFTIKLTNLENGMSGDLRITSSTIITITLPSSSKLNGNVSNLPAGIYHLAWVYNGSVLDFNIALYE